MGDKLMADVMVPDGMKECHMCHEVKPLSAFWKQKKHKDGLDYYCSMCRRETRVSDWGTAGWDEKTMKSWCKKKLSEVGFDNVDQVWEARWRVRDVPKAGNV